MNGSKIIETLEKYEPRYFHHEANVVWDRASGYHVYDKEGKEYIDFSSGIFVANVGHADYDVLRAVYDQMATKSLFHAYAFPTEVRAKLVKKLSELTGMEKVFLCSTGSEAVEVALRCMREFRNRNPILSQKGCFHGNTLGSKQLQGEGSGACLEYTRYPDTPVHKWNTILPDWIAGIIFESYFGWNAQFHPVGWIQAWCNWAKENKIPVCFDEIQSGFGRTGRWFAYEHYGVKPDLIVIGKALGGGLPISAVCGRADLLDAPDNLSSTHSANPICCAAALAVIEKMGNENLVEQAEFRGHFFEDELKNIGYQVNGKGMIWAIDLENVNLANRVVDACVGKGLIMVKTHRGTLKLGPPLIMPGYIIQQGIKIIKEAINECKVEACGNCLPEH